MKRTFVLGIGTQKAGTTWLFRLLSQSPGYVPGWTKEYHVWDVREIPILSHYRIRPLEIHRKTKRRLFLMQNFPRLYFSHFEKILSFDGAVSCDITPAYCGLGKQTLREIKQRIESKGITFKCIFIMRDPVSRCVSAFNMLRSRNPAQGLEGVNLTKTADVSFTEYFQSSDAMLRTEYQKTIQNLRSAYVENDYIILSYEDLFEIRTIQRIQDFLEIRLNVDFGGNRVHATGKSEEVSQGAKLLCRDFYSDTYKYVHERFPNTKELWK